MTNDNATTTPPARAATTQVLYPAYRYERAHAAIDWLCAAFGFERYQVYDGPDDTVAHAVLDLNGGFFMLGSPRPDSAFPAKLPREAGGVTGGIYAYVPDPDAHCARARAAGATIAREPSDTEYGSREYSAFDCQGYWWTFGTYRP